MDSTVPSRKSLEVLTIKPKSSLRPGHPWIYRGQIDHAPSSMKPGALVKISLPSGRFFGVGYYNPSSEIAFRLLTQIDEPIDKAFFKKRIKKAADFRKQLTLETNAFRLISSEADELPGLIVDRYDEVLVIQFLTAGMERLREIFLEALAECIPCRGIYERSDSGSRKIEGLEPQMGWIRQDCADETVVFERNIKFKVRFGAGQKTGLYLDQRENRMFLASLGVQGEVLDAFCSSGGFGLHLASAGAKVLGVESQKEAIAQGLENRSLNGIPASALEFQEANVFDALKAFEKERRKFRLVILDPPSFVKKRQAIEGALSGYKEILLRSMKILENGGLLAVFSCSYHVDDNLLMQAALSAAWDLRRGLKILKFFKQSADHPINPFIPETYYLKGFLFSATSS